MDNLKGLLGIRKLDKVVNAWIRVVRSDGGRLMKVFCDTSVILKEYGMMG